MVHPVLNMNKHSLQEVASHKHLVIIFSDNGSWHNHIDSIVKKAFTRVNALRRLWLVLHRFTLEKMYLTYIRPLLEYDDVIRDNKKEYLSEKV